MERAPRIIQVLSLAALVLGLYLLGETASRLGDSGRAIQPVEDTTRELVFIRRHWFSKDEVIRLYARRDENGDWKWMTQAGTNGEWYPFFSYNAD